MRSQGPSLREGPGPWAEKAGVEGSAWRPQAGRGLTECGAGEGGAMDARVSAQLCPGHAGVQGVDSHTRAWGRKRRLREGSSLTWEAVAAHTQLWGFQAPGCFLHSNPIVPLALKS